MTNKNITSMTSNELKKLYLQTFKEIAPKGYTKHYLTKTLNWYYKYNSLTPEISLQLENLVLNHCIKQNAPKKVSTILTNGTKLIREFKGNKYEVLLQENGYLFENNIYKSLSAIANKITGTHWNGKKFFGVANGK